MKQYFLFVYYKLFHPITHSQFADDTLLEAYPSVQEILMNKSILNTYEAASRQEVNTTKSKLYDINIHP